MPNLRSDLMSVRFARKFLIGVVANRAGSTTFNLPRDEPWCYCHWYMTFICLLCSMPIVSDWVKAEYNYEYNYGDMLTDDWLCPLGRDDVSCRLSSIEKRVTLHYMYIHPDEFDRLVFMI